MEKQLNFEIKKVSENIHENVLNMFVGKEINKPWMTKPFTYNEYVCSTDSHRLCYFDKAKCGAFDFYDLNHAANFIQKFESNFEFSVERLKRDVLALDMEDDFNEVGENIECKKCDGDGQVQMTFEGNTYDRDCPTCNGSGFSEQTRHIPTGFLRICWPQKCKIGNSLFDTNFIKDIISIAELFNVDQVGVMQTLPFKQTTFQIGDIKLLIMPMLASEDDELKFVIANTSELIQA